MMKVKIGLMGARSSAANFCVALLRDESGQDLIEYALVAALVGLGAVASIRSLSTSIGSAFSNIGTRLTTSV